MTHDQLNEYIEQYLEADKTKTAIMLTGAWGSGKTYYIEDVLMEYLEKKGKTCIVVSLYGIKDIGEISKAVYMELRSVKLFKSKVAKSTVKMFEKTILKNIFKSKEVKSTVKILGKTILKNSSLFIPGLSVNMGVDKKDLYQLYESVDLTDKLIIFEDIERSHVDIIEFLGYVNNLVERDRVKVMLVANEDEILNRDMPIDIRNEDEKLEYELNKIFRKKEDLEKEKELIPSISENVKKYIVTKEKTISDTIQYTGNYTESISNILKSFEAECLNDFLKEEKLAEIIRIVKQYNGNLRTFIFACQKGKDILQRKDNCSEELAQCIFYSIIIFSYKFRKNNQIEWNGNEELSLSLGSERFPLFRVCYQYIYSHSITNRDLDKLEDYYSRFKQHSKSSVVSDDIQTIFQYHIKTEEQLKASINNVEEQLRRNSVSLYQYGSLAYYLIIISKILSIDIKECKKYLISNLRGKSLEMDVHYLFLNDHMIEDKHILAEYEQLRAEMIESLNHISGETWYGFNYCPDKINDFYTYVIERSGVIFEQKNFVYRMNIEKLITMIKRCNAQQIYNLRGVFLAVYRASNIRETYSKDRDKLEQLKKDIIKLMEDKIYGDKIIKLQLEFFVENLEDIINRLQ